MRQLVKNTLRWLTHRSLCSVTIAFCSGDREVLSHISIEDVVARIEKFLDGLPLIHFLAFQLMILTFEFAFVPITRKIRPLRFLSEEQQLRYMERWCESRFMLKRIAYIGLKYICMAQIYSEHALLESIGYGPDLRARMNGTNALGASKRAEVRCDHRRKTDHLQSERAL